jgi:two-component system nitrogen regulation response regulator NtrX
LFGHAKGAFTGAVADKPGKLELAADGTVFLDEIGDMSLPVQARLLRFLQEGEFERVGGTRTIKVDVRVIAATNKNLAGEIEQRRFREDLYYRLSVVVLTVPPLRERPADIPLLAEHFLRRFCTEHGVPVKRLQPDALGLLAGQTWPGNVRELANVIQRCVVLLRKQELAASDITPLLGTCGASAGQVDRSLKAVREESERRHLLTVLAECDWNMTEAARVLEVDRTTLYRHMDRLGIDAGA